MTNELISKKSLLKEIDEVIAQYNWADDGIIMDILMCARDMVCDQPTAYDIDKVIEQLESEASHCASFFDGYYTDDYERGKFEAYNEAVEIVKRGGEQE